MNKIKTIAGNNNSPKLFVLKLPINFSIVKINIINVAIINNNLIVGNNILG